MKRCSALKVSGATLFLIMSVMSCAISQTRLPPDLSLRLLDISDKVPGFQYQWRECVKQFLGMCRKEEVHTEYYDLTNPAVKQKLKDMGFKAVIPGK